MTEDNKRKCKDDLLSNKKICLSPSITQDDPLLPSTVHDSPAMPVPSSSHDPLATPPQSSSHDIDLPMKVLHSSPHEQPATPPQFSSKDLVSSPSSHNLPATPPGSHDMPLQPNPVDKTAHPDSGTMPPKLHDTSIKSHPRSHDPDKHDGSLLDNCDSGSPPLVNTEQQDQLEFIDPPVDIINTQLNQQITKVQHFLKSDRLKRTKLPDTNTDTNNVQ